ncbi:phage protein Gp27 family protein [uncultured Halopseudomonas sp.]|uniref:phage protein Gp27 family protein n=1 Tax=uncultured Halopseudomonas sp. TaxID=2901193 RepID=UPI0030ED1430|tara:strand:- start:2875 stop:3423 length:549 start_codon:yes stop_codon:yes gene_type:complete
MGRKSSIEKLPKEVRSHIERTLRENRLTLDELIQELQALFPEKETPSRSAVGRYKVGFDQMIKEMRQQQNMASQIVEDLGENPDEKGGALMVQLLTTITTRAAMDAQNDEDTSIEDVRKLARATKDVLSARKVSREERKAIERETREKLIAEQEQRLEEMRGSDGMSEQLESRIRNVLLGKA